MNEQIELASELHHLILLYEPELEKMAQAQEIEEMEKGRKNGNVV